jgi:hypothetical protein
VRGTDTYTQNSVERQASCELAALNDFDVVIVDGCLWQRLHGVLSSCVVNNRRSFVGWWCVGLVVRALKIEPHAQAVFMCDADGGPGGIRTLDQQVSPWSMSFDVWFLSL